MDNQSKAGWDIFLFGIPLIALLVFGFFSLDQVLPFHKRETPDTPSPRPSDKRHQKSMCSDPDGRPWDDD